MTRCFRGRSWVFGAGVTTDDILPGQYLDRSNDEAASFAMAGLDPEFTKRVAPGDFVVAGANFGAGSGRENAVAALVGAGIAAVIAPSFGRLFYRNAINLGLPAAIVSRVERIEPGDPLVLDLEARTLRNERSEEVLDVENLGGTALEILEAGGIVPFTRARLGI